MLLSSSCKRFEFRLSPAEIPGDGMQSIKFISLIVMCATSCLALLLPAVGVVPFPKQLSGINTQLPPTNPSPNGAFSNQNASSNPMPGLPISAPNVTGLPVSPTLSSSNFGGLDPTQGTGTTISPSTGIEIVSKYDTLGFGIWLLLVPIWIVSLVVWSVTPTPKNRSK